MRQSVIVFVFAWFVVCNVFNISSKNLSTSDLITSSYWNAYVTTTSQLAFTTFSALCASALISPVLRLSALIAPLKLTIYPGISLAAANLSMHWALSRTSVGMFQTAKSASPLFTAFACHFILHRRYSRNTYLSLLPIVTGLGLASVTDLEFELVGLLACLFSAMCQVFVNLSLKAVLEETFCDLQSSGDKRSLYAFEVQTLVCFCGLCTLVVFGGLYALLVSSPFEEGVLVDEARWSDVFNQPLQANVLLYAGESVLAYAVNARLTRLPYAVVDAVRRLSIVIVSNVFFHFDKMYPSDLSRSLNFLAVAAVGGGAVTFTLVVKEVPHERDSTV